LWLTGVEDHSEKCQGQTLLLYLSKLVNVCKSPKTMEWHIIYINILPYITIYYPISQGTYLEGLGQFRSRILQGSETAILKRCLQTHNSIVAAISPAIKNTYAVLSGKLTYMENHHV
jgi:hypothetical protein